MSVTIYRSSDSSAPVLTGQNGSLTALLTACLVTGYGAKAAAGWSLPFTDTNLSVYRAPTAPGSPSEANRRYLRVNDNLATTYGASVKAFDTMTDANTGTNQFPTSIQNSGRVYLRKSLSSDATARPWIVIASDRSFYMIAACNSSTFAQTSGGDAAFFFGDFTSYVPGDTYNTAILGSGVLNTGTNQERFGRVDSSGTFLDGGTATNFGRVLRAPWHGFGVSVEMGLLERKAVPTTVLGSLDYGADYPDPIRGGLILNRVEITEAARSGNILKNRIRGYLPGLWTSENKASPGNFYDTIDGTGYFAGRQFIILPVYHVNLSGRMYLETTDTWY